jgi:hypothetical protein
LYTSTTIPTNQPKEGNLSHVLYESTIVSVSTMRLGYPP